MLYIDPGTSKGCAVACFLSPHAVTFPTPPGTLAGLGVWDLEQGLTHQWGRALEGGYQPAVWEMPQLYPSARREKPQAMIAKANDLIRLSAAGSACATALSWGRGGVRSMLPAQWKKQLPKPIHHSHVMRVLTADERALIEAAWVDRAPAGERRARQADPAGTLAEYIRKGCLWVAKHPGKELKGYTSCVTDLLDAVAFGLSQEGRLVL